MAIISQELIDDDKFLHDVALPYLRACLSSLLQQEVDRLTMDIEKEFLYGSGDSEPEGFHADE
jgi:hypothetical protein